MTAAEEDPADAARRAAEEALGAPTVPAATAVLAVAKVAKERDGYLASLRQVQADFENFRKRSQRHQEDSATKLAERVLVSLLPSLDAFDLAIEHLADEVASPSGMVQAATLLRDTLAKEGLERLGRPGEVFDPKAHEAVEHAAGEGVDGGPVIEEVLRPGYRWKGRVIRAAMVKVRG